MDQETKDMASGQLVTTMHSPVRMDALLGLVTGFAGGLLAKAALDSWTRRDLLLAAFFGLVFGLLVSRKTDSPRAGRIWGLGSAFLVWIALPAGLGPLLFGIGACGSMCIDALDHFPYLLA